MKKLIASLVVAAAVSVGVSAAAGADGNGYGRAGQACAEAGGFKSLGALMGGGAQFHGNAAGGVQAALANR